MKSCEIRKVANGYIVFTVTYVSGHDPATIRDLETIYVFNTIDELSKFLDNRFSAVK